MSTPATLFTIYFIVGLLLLAGAVASPGKEEGTKGLEAIGLGGEFDVGLLIFIALPWPIWILSWLGKKSRQQRPKTEAPIQAAPATPGPRSPGSDC